MINYFLLVGFVRVQIDWLAQTKLVAPRLREDLVPRQRLYDALNSLIHSHPLTLISAPPGYGKTTLLASLPVVFPGLPLTWISLGEEDNEFHNRLKYYPLIEK